MSIFQSLFKLPTRSILGLDISSSAVKVLELGKRGDQYVVEAFGVEPLPVNAIVDKQIADLDVVAEAIKRAVQRSGSRTKLVAVAVADSSVITKIVQMSGALNDNEMEEQIKAEADQYIPYPIDEVNVDFHVLGPSDRNDGSVDVLLAACRREQVDQRIAAIEQAGFKAVVVDIEAYALENACQFLQPQMPNGGRDKTIAVVDMGASTTAIVIVTNGKTVYTREQAFGGKHLTEDIMRVYGMSFEDAGRAKKMGGLPEGYESEILGHFLNDMAQQIDRSFQFFFAASTSHAHVDQIILAGGCANIAGVEQLIEERLGIPTVIARPFSGMNIAAKAKPNLINKDEPALLIACGLANRAYDEKGGA